MEIIVTVVTISLGQVKITRNENSLVIIAGLSFYGDRSIDYQKWLYGDPYFLSPKRLRASFFFICLILLNLLTTNIPHHIETSQLICNAIVSPKRDISRR